MAEPSGRGASASSSVRMPWLPRVVAGSLLVLQIAAPVAPARGSRAHSESSEDRWASVQLEQARGSSPDFSSRSELSSDVVVVRPPSATAQDMLKGSSVVSPEEREELAVIFDSMLISSQRDTDVPFQERIGAVEDPRILALMQEIDTTLGGGIQWPDVHVNDDPAMANRLGFYYPDVSDKDWSDFHTWDASQSRLADTSFGIHLSKSVVDKEFETGVVDSLSVRQTLVHELQHSMSVDNGRDLMAAADRSNNPYEYPSTATSEGRASISMVVYAEMEQRAAADGPRLNELSNDERYEVMRGVLQQYVAPVVSPPQDLLDKMLLEAVREERYLRDPENKWHDALDRRTTDYVMGVDRYTPEEPFVPDIWDLETGDSVRDLDARRLELATPLDELAGHFAEERARSPRNEAEYLSRMNASEAPVGSLERVTARDAAGAGSAGSLKDRVSARAEPRSNLEPSKVGPREARFVAGVVRRRESRSAPAAVALSDALRGGRVNRFFRAVADSVADLRMLVRPRFPVPDVQAGESVAARASRLPVHGRSGLPPGLAGVTVRGPIRARSVSEPSPGAAAQVGGSVVRRLARGGSVDVPTPRHRPVVVPVPSPACSERGVQR